MWSISRQPGTGEGGEPARRATRRFPTTYRFLRLLLTAEDPFKQGGVPVVLDLDDFAIAVGERIGLESGFSARADLREDDHDIVVGEETAGRYLEVLLGDLPEQFLDPVFAAICSADRVGTGYDELDAVVVVVQTVSTSPLSNAAYPFFDVSMF